MSTGLRYLPMDDVVAAMGYEPISGYDDDYWAEFVAKLPRISDEDPDILKDAIETWLLLPSIGPEFLFEWGVRRAAARSKGLPPPDTDLLY